MKHTAVDYALIVGMALCVIFAVTLAAMPEFEVFVIDWHPYIVFHSGKVLG